MGNQFRYIGANKVYSLNEIGALVESIGEHKGYPTEIVHLEGRHEVKHAFSDHGKAEKHLDFKDNTNIEETISEMFDWAIKQPSRPLKKMNYEITKGMYGYWK